MSTQLINSSVIKYIQQFDAVPQFWQYLQGLRSDDLIAELIQNELDEDTSHTSITFDADQLTCQGNGYPVDKDGWTRLSFIMGAGNLAPRKHQRIGVKNHGLKVCFTVGDDINVRSNGKFINQTLYKDGINRPPSPGAYAHPLPDETAPNKGCLVEVPYRCKKLTVNIGEPLEFAPTSAEMIERLFLKACREVPQRFIGALRPHTRQRYVIDLSHHRLGTVRFEFSCGRERPFHRSKLYNRTCRISGNVQELPHELNESCCLFAVPLPKGSNREIPEFYSAREGFFLAEIAWKTQGSGRPVSSFGRRRYPIAYGGTDQSAFTGVGLHFSGPYISDLERHGASDATAFNDYIDNTCRSMLVTILRYKLIPQHGAKVMNLLMMDPENPDEDNLRKLVEQLLEAGVFPLSQRVAKTRRDTKQSRHKKRRKAVRFGPSHTPEGKIRRLVLPIFTWEEDKVSPLLAELCPAGEDQIAPSVPRPILKLLAKESCEGWAENHIRFDEINVIERFQPTCNIECFPWPDEYTWRAALGDPDTACRCLDVAMAVYEDGPGFDDEELTGLLDNAFLPDTTPVAIPLPKLYAGVHLPIGLPIRNMPPIIHPQVAKHRIFKKKRWKRTHFTFDEFLDRAEIEGAEEETRRLFWQWVKANWKSVPKRQWARIAGLQIWPDNSGVLLSLSALCKPHKEKVTTILKDVLHTPDSQVLRISPVKKAKRGRLYIRTKPTETEIATFTDKRLLEFPRGKLLSDEEQEHFHAFETDLAELALDYKLRGYLKNISENAIALDGSGYLRPVRELVQVDDEVKALYLLKEDIIDRPSSILDRIDGWRPKTFPSSDQVLKALKQDAHRRDALLPRLQAYLQTSKREYKDHAEDDIVDIECIPHDGKLYAPGNIAFTSGRGDYWGTWKHRISGKGLSADVQKVYLSVGVLGSDPTPDTSLAFFQWLNCQNPETVAAHLACVIRHINHRRGLSSWHDENPGCPFIPVEAVDGGIQLVSQMAATSQRSGVLIPDFEALEVAIRQMPGRRGSQLTILSHPEVREPITPFLRQLGVKSLRNYAGDPVKVEGKAARPAPKNTLDELDNLRTRKMSKELRKRLDELELDTHTSELRGHWRDRLDQIRNVSVATSVMATFQVGHRRYTIPMDTAFDEQTGIIWLADSEADLEDRFFQVITERIFENPPKFLPIVLREALRREFHEEGLLYGTWQSDVHGKDDEEDDWDEDEEEHDDEEPGATDQTHQGVPPDHSKNLPKPGVIPTAISGPGKPSSIFGGRRGGRDQNGKTGRTRGREPSKLEEIQIEDLKQNQYAWHCQICLTERSTEQLAPPRSYVEIQENRRRVIRNHHPDQVHAGGARHAGNMLVLCSYHHLYLGDAISRYDVTEALKATATDHKVVFRTFSHGSVTERTIFGKLITIQVPLTGEAVKCFFTDSHAKYWLQKASE